MDRAAVEERIRNEFAIALAQLEHAAPEDKLQAQSRLNRAVRRLLDFVAHGKLPLPISSTVKPPIGQERSCGAASRRAKLKPTFWCRSSCSPSWPQSAMSARNEIKYHGAATVEVGQLRQGGRAHVQQLPRKLRNVDVLSHLRSLAIERQQFRSPRPHDRFHSNLVDIFRSTDEFYHRWESPFGTVPCSTRA